jgi:hypothetical protein
MASGASHSDPRGAVVLLVGCALLASENSVVAGHPRSTRSVPTMPAGNHEDRELRLEYQTNVRYRGCSLRPVLP